MRITSASFLGAAGEPGRFPPAGHPEIAFAGRSNVGKSSALNRLLGRRRLARVSGTPGRTQQLNFFLVDDRLVLVDLPGYGYARVSQATRAAWRPLVESYLRGRAVLAGVVLLVDVRRGLEDEEHALLDVLRSLELPALLVATKIDKLNRGARARALATFSGSGAGRDVAGGPPAVPVVPFSALTGEGADALWRVVLSWIEPAKR
jgi:GTP-binding protein